MKFRSRLRSAVAVLIDIVPAAAGDSDREKRAKRPAALVQRGLAIRAHVELTIRIGVELRGRLAA